MTDRSIRFGDNVAKARKAKGWTQLKLSLMANVAKSYLSEVETGKRNPTLNEMVKIADALGVSLQSLIDF